MLQINNLIVFNARRKNYTDSECGSNEGIKKQPEEMFTVKRIMYV